MTWFHLLIFSFLIYHSVYCKETKNKDENQSNLNSFSMEKLLQMENRLIKSLEAHSKKLQQTLDMIQLYQQRLKRPKMYTNKMQEEYMSNPLNGLRLMRRIKQDWPKLLKHFNDAETQAHVKIEKMQKLLKPPREKDLLISIAGLLRIESFYNLEASHMAKGLLLKKQYDSYLDSADCLALGDYLYNRTSYSRSQHWYRTAIRLHQQPNDELYNKLFGLNRKKLFRKYAQAIAFEPNASQESLANSTDSIMQDMADKYMKQLVTKAKNKQIKQLVDKYLEQDEQIFIDDRARKKAKLTTMERACQGLWPKRKDQRLTCRYQRKNSAYQILAPLKLEILNIKPRILLYHNVLHDSEIKDIKNIAQQKPTIEDDKNGVNSITLQDSNAPLQRSLNRRVAEMTGINIPAHNDLNLLSYGLGGYLGQQKCQDSERKSCKKQLTRWRRNRIATTIFYASHVPLGGANIFPKLQLEVKPKRGSALVWYNLNEAGKPNPLAKHAVCPVVLGSRLAITKCLDAAQQVPQMPCLA